LTFFWGKDSGYDFYQLITGLINITQPEYD